MTKKNMEIFIGELVGYTKGSDPKKTKIFVLARVQNRTIRIPIDQKLRKSMQNEYPVGSKVELGFDGTWHIRSRLAPNDFKDNSTDHSIFL